MEEEKEEEEGGEREKGGEGEGRRRRQIHYSIKMKDLKWLEPQRKQVAAA